MRSICGPAYGRVRAGRRPDGGWRPGCRTRRSRHPHHRAAGPRQRYPECVRQRRLRDHVAKVDSQVHHGLRDLRTNAADDALRSHEPRGGHGLEQMLRRQGIDRGHAGDVEDGDLRAGFDDSLQQRLHRDLRARAVEGADHRKRQDPVPERHHRRREFEEILLLPPDQIFAALLVHLRREQCERIQEAGQCHEVARDLVGVRLGLRTHVLQHRHLRREDEHRGLRWGVSLRGTRPRQRGEKLLGGRPLFLVDRRHASRERRHEQSQKLRTLRLDQRIRECATGRLLGHPFRQDLIRMPGECRGDSPAIRRRLDRASIVHRGLLSEEAAQIQSVSGPTAQSQTILARQLTWRLWRSSALRMGQCKAYADVHFRRVPSYARAVSSTRKFATMRATARGLDTPPAHPVPFPAAMPIISRLP